MDVRDYDDYNIVGAIEDIERVQSLVEHLAKWALNAQYALEADLKFRSSSWSNDTTADLSRVLRDIQRVRSSLACGHGEIYICWVRLKDALKSFPRNTTKEPL